MQGAHDPEYPDDPTDGVELIRPDDFLPRNPFPQDAQRMGVDRWSEDAGMIAIASSLDSSKRSHKAVAWLMLIAVTAWVLMQLWFELSS